MTVPPCPAEGALVDGVIDKILTQYRESPKLIALLTVFLDEAEDAARVISGIPSFFDLDTAVGDQLTLLGKRLGWPRCHCICDFAPVFGFDCGGGSPVPNEIPVVGFCEGGTWLSCREVGAGQLCFDDDEVYRGYLKARRYQALALFDIENLNAAARHVWGEQASVVSAGGGRVVIAPGRALTDTEIVELPVAFRVMPIAPGIQALVHLGVGQIFGFGDGWGGFCADPGEDEAEWLCPIDAHPYDCAA